MESNEIIFTSCLHENSIQSLNNELTNVPLTSDVEHGLIQSAKTSYKCTLCDKKFTQTGYLTMHMRVHSGENRHRCVMCDKKFAQNGDLKNHLRVKHRLIYSGAKPYTCTQCDKKFTELDHLKNHLRVHSGEKSYKCRRCEKAFIGSNHLKTHMRVHSRKKTYKCTRCGKKFTGSGHLKTHMRVHSGEKLYKCTRCVKKFTGSDNLKTHMRVHSKKKPYKCTQCVKKFIRSYSLENHMRVHSGEKPYKCPQCRMKYSRSSDLKKHKRIHAGEKPYECAHCDKKFAQRHQLKSHFSKEPSCNTSIPHCQVERPNCVPSREKLCECLQCNRKFISTKLLIEHIQSHCNLLNSMRPRNLNEMVFAHPSGRNINNLGNDTLGESLVNPQVQDNGSTRSMDDVISETLTVHSPTDQYDVTMLVNKEDVKLEVIEIVPRKLDNSWEFIHKDIKNDTFGGSLVNSQDTGSTRSMDDVSTELLTIHSQSDQCDVTMLEKNEDDKMEVSEIFPRNIDNVCEQIHEDIKPDITTVFHDHNESNKVKSTSVISIEVKIVFSLNDNITDLKTFADWKLNVRPIVLLYRQPKVEPCN